MWRGVTVWPRFMTGASMVRAGWLANGKMVIYPIRDLGDGKQLINCLSGTADVPAALTQYEALRLPPTTQVVLMHRKNPPDAILREVNERTGGKPFARIGDVIPEAELRAIAELYKTVAGYDKKALAG